MHLKIELNFTINILIVFSIIEIGDVLNTKLSARLFFWIIQIHPRIKLKYWITGYNQSILFMRICRNLTKETYIFCHFSFVFCLRDRAYWETKSCTSWYVRYVQVIFQHLIPSWVWRIHLLSVSNWTQWFSSVINPCLHVYLKDKLHANKFTYMETGGN